MIKFIVDSTFGVEKKYALENDIRIVNLKLVLDGIATDEGFSDTWNEFYERLEKSKDFPKTSQANPQTYIDYIEEILEKDPDASIIILTIASGLSSTYNSANLAVSGYEGKNITVIDTMNVNACSRIMLEEMVEFSKKENDFKKVVEFGEEIRQKFSIYFIPDSMEYLRRGGRIGLITSKIVDIISIKPVFEFRNNVLKVITKALGFTKAVGAMLKKIPENIKKFMIVYIHDDKHIAPLVEKVKEVFQVNDVEIQNVDPVFGVHVGPKSFGLVCLEN